MKYIRFLIFEILMLLFIYSLMSFMSFIRLFMGSEISLMDKVSLITILISFSFCIEPYLISLNTVEIKLFDSFFINCIILFLLMFIFIIYGVYSENYDILVFSIGFFPLSGINSIISEKYG